MQCFLYNDDQQHGAKMDTSRLSTRQLFERFNLCFLICVKLIFSGAPNRSFEKRVFFNNFDESKKYYYAELHGSFNTN